MQRDYNGAERGVGAAYAWKGNNKAGEGRMEITEVAAPAKIVLRLDFVKPFKATNTAEFTFKSLGQASGDATVVTWALYGPQPFPSKIMGTLFNMDDLIGKDFEAGLNNLKTLAETPAEPAAEAVAQGDTQ
ncbi:MAG: SRPBCC family protein, partial [Asticcacaulis sp.]|nr:SRPBCC family protein [Asticcacaulis sp.]